MPEYLDKVADTVLQARHYLHQNPELSGNEVNTHDWLVKWFTVQAIEPILHKNLGRFKTGLVAEYATGQPGPTIMLRADTDALPIVEDNELDYVSGQRGVMHACGHDGHTSLLLGIAAQVHHKALKCGRLLLLFQPAEEIGKGALSLLEDARFLELKPDFIFGLHNIPGEELGKILIKDGAFCFASTGLKIVLTGYSSHAAEPEKAHSPALAMAEILTYAQNFANSNTTKLAVTYAGLGEPAFGICPGTAIVHLTCRSTNDIALDSTLEKVKLTVEKITHQYQIDTSFTQIEPFAATTNNPEAFNSLTNAFNNKNFKYTLKDSAYFWSEDFGQLSKLAPSCFFGLGSGLATKPLHHPSYNFPDGLIMPGITIWQAIIDYFLR